MRNSPAKITAVASFCLDALSHALLGSPSAIGRLSAGCGATPLNELLGIDARASVVLPLRWTAATRLPSLADALPAGVLRWPAGAPVVEVTQRSFRDVSELCAAPPDLIFAEADTGAELEALACAASRFGSSALVFMGSGLRRLYGDAVEFASPSLVVLPWSELRAELLREAGRFTEQLVRERATVEFLRHWRAALAEYAAVGVAATSGRFSLEALSPRPNMAPLSTIEHAHVAGVVGLWFEGAAKPGLALGVSARRLHRVLDALPAGFSRGIAPLPPLTGARLLVVEDDHRLARATARAFESAGARLGRALEVEVVHTAQAAIAHIEAAGAPELLWVDVQLPGAMNGIDLVQWLRRERLASVVFGKTGASDRETVRQLSRLGAIGIWCGFGLPSLASAVSSGLAAAAEAQAIRTGEVEAALLDERLTAQLQRALTTGAAQHRASEVSARLEALEADLAQMPAPTGLGHTTLDELRLAAAVQATAGEGSVRSAAASLGVDVKTLRALLLQRPRASGG